MHHDIYIVYQCPFIAFFYMIGTFVAFFFYQLFNRIGNSINLNIGLRFANDEKISYGLINLSQVESYYIFTLLFFNSMNNCLENFAVFCEPGRGLFPALQRSDYFIQIANYLFLFGNIRIIIKFK